MCGNLSNMRIGNDLILPAMIINHSLLSAELVKFPRILMDLL